MACAPNISGNARLVPGRRRARVPAAALSRTRALFAPPAFGTRPLRFACVLRPRGRAAPAARLWRPRSGRIGPRFAPRGRASPLRPSAPAVFAPRRPRFAAAFRRARGARAPLPCPWAAAGSFSVALAASRASACGWRSGGLPLGAPAARLRARAGSCPGRPAAVGRRFSAFGGRGFVPLCFGALRVAGSPCAPPVPAAPLGLRGGAGLILSGPAGPQRLAGVGSPGVASHCRHLPALFHCVRVSRPSRPAHRLSWHIARTNGAALTFPAHSIPSRANNP